jgi:FkbM family methyltransferase
MKLLKKPILKAINSLGYTVVKLPLQPRKNDTLVEVAVAGRRLVIHSGNPLWKVYQQNPSCNRALAVIAKLVTGKYPDAWAFDVGANIGDTLAVILSQAKLPVVCVEGDSHCYGLLQQNARQFESVHTLNVFLSSQPETVNVKIEKAGWNTTLLETEKTEATRQIKFETIDNIASQLGCRNRVQLIKVDTEGFDIRILRGAAGILSATKPVVSFELNKENIAPLGDSVADFFDFLSGHGYNNYFLTDPDGKPICTLSAGDGPLFSSLYKYSGPMKPVCYFDVLAFHANDQDLFDLFVKDQDEQTSQLTKN